MKAVGIIVEYNPFHNGHLYHLNKTKELFKDHVIIAVMSGNFMQRGEPSIIDKWERTKIALDNGIDLVVELPFPFATSSADLFAKGSVGLLNALKVDALVFGSENGDINKLKEAAENLNNINIKEELKKGISYPKAISEKLNGDIKTPNDILGVSYIKEILNLKSNITPVTFKRTNDYHSEKLSEISSATSIRNSLEKNENVDIALPNETKKRLNNLVFIENFFPLLKYKILSEINNLDKYNLVDEGIENKIKKHINESSSLDELILKVKSKRYTYSKLRRMFTHILIGYTKEENKRLTNLEYIRVLGFSDTGSKYLKEVKKDNLKIITNFNNKSEMLNLEMRATSVYDLIAKNNLVEKEYKNNGKNII